MDGLAVARERIAREAAEKTGFLDIGYLGLSRLPDELFALKNLRRGNLGRQYWDEKVAWWRLSELDIGPNEVEGQTKRLCELRQLEALFLNVTILLNLAPLGSRVNLKELRCSFTQVTDLATLGSLKNLQTLDCSDTRVSDLAPLGSLKNLQTLDCSST